MPRERQNPRAAREALANDRLRTAVDVVSTLDGMRVRQEQLDMERGRQEAQADMLAEQKAAMAREAAKAKYDLWEKTRRGEDTANLSQALVTIDPDDSDAVEAVGASRAGFIYADDFEKRALEQKAALAEARRAQFRENEMKLGVRAEDFMRTVDGVTRPDGTPVARLDRTAYGQALTVADRVKTEYRSKLANYDDMELFDTLTGDRGVSLPQAQQMMERHQEVQNYLKTAAELGIDGAVLDAVAKATRVNVRSRTGKDPLPGLTGDSEVTGDPLNTDTAVFMYDDRSLSRIKSATVNGGPALGNLVAERMRMKAQSGEAKVVAEAQGSTNKAVLDAVKSMKEGPEKDRLLRAVAVSMTSSQQAETVAGGGVSNPGGVDEGALQSSMGTAKSDAAAVEEALRSPTPTSKPAPPAIEKKASERFTD